MFGTFTTTPDHGQRKILTLSLPRALVGVTLVANAIYWIIQFTVDLKFTGLFYFIGVDWSRFWGAARALVSSDPSAAYNLGAIGQYMQPFAAYYGSGSSRGLLVHGLRVGPVPYPPIFLYLFAPLTQVPPLAGFAIWTVLNAALAAWIVYQLTARLPNRSRWVVFALLMFSYPMAINFYVGQLVVILMAGFYLAYRDLQRGLEFRAGLWLGVLLLKPQYIVVPVLVLLFKRRWHAIAGTAATGVVIALTSLAAGGFAGVQGYVRMILLHYPGYSGGVAIDPHSMDTWRSLIYDVLPHISSLEGFLLTALLSAISLAALIPIWTGRWDPRSPEFHTKMLATMCVTQLVAYHSHLHGAILLIVPAVLMVAEGQASRMMQWLMAAGLVGPPFAAGLSILLFHDLRLIGVLYIALMFVALIWILLDQPTVTRAEPAKA
jgi:hypothetical protein